jgi:hypothetical protein
MDDVIRRVHNAVSGLEDNLDRTLLDTVFRVHIVHLMTRMKHFRYNSYSITECSFILSLSLDTYGKSTHRVCFHI